LSCSPQARSSPSWGTASAFSTVRDFILDREAQSVDYCIGAALRPKVISFRSTDGVPLHGVLLGSGQNGIVLGGGHHFRENLCDWLPFARTLAQRGYRVLAYDSRPIAPRRLSRPAAVHLVRDVVGAERELVRGGVRRVLVGGAGPVGGTAAMAAAALMPAVSASCAGELTGRASTRVVARMNVLSRHVR
jgi:hypothetical protein